MPRRLASLLALAVAMPAWADFRADYAPVKHGDEEMPSLSRMEFAGQRLRTDTGRISMLFDAGSGKLITLNHDRHRYIDMDKAAAARAGSNGAPPPPDARAHGEARPGAAGTPGGEPPPKITTTQTGKTDRVGDRTCEISSIEIDGDHVQDICLATLADAGIPAADQAGLRSTLGQLKALAEKNAGPMRSPLADMPVDRIPLRITSFDEDGAVAEVIELKQLTTAPVAAGDFAIPAGYSEEQLGPRAH